MRKKLNPFQRLISIFVVLAFCLAQAHVLFDYAAPNAAHSNHCADDVPSPANEQDVNASDDCSCLCHSFEDKSFNFSSLQLYMPCFMLELPSTQFPTSTYPDRIERPPQA